jgi:hypothetical protein
LLVCPFAQFFPHCELAELIPGFHECLSSRLVQALHAQCQEAISAIIPAMQLTFHALRDLKRQFFRDRSFTYRLLSLQIGEAWNKFCSPFSAPGFDEISESFPSFDDVWSFKFHDSGGPENGAHIVGTLQTILSCLAPFADLLPSRVVRLWDRFADTLDISIIQTPISQAVQDLRNTVHTLALDAGVPESQLMRLDWLLRLSQLKWQILFTPKVAIDFFPVVVIPPARTQVDEKENHARALGSGCDSSL